MNKIVIFCFVIFNSYAMENDTAATVPKKVEIATVLPTPKDTNKNPKTDKLQELQVIKAELVREGVAHSKRRPCGISWENL